MKRYLRQMRPTSDDRSSSGSVTLEAALVMPLFLFFSLTLIALIYASAVSMALHGALSNATRQAAVAWYPLSLSLDKVREHPVYTQAEAWNGRVAEVGEALRKYGKVLPEPLQSWAETAADGSEAVRELPARLAAEQWVRSLADRNVLHPSDIRVTQLLFPSGETEDDGFFTLSAEYPLPFRLPFSDRKVVIAASAKERVWIGGKPSAARQLSDNPQAGTLSFVSLEPNPVRPGRKATLTVRASPGEAVDLSVYYKSGASEAKHLGTATADSSGLVVWTWHVSGRTTPGEWSWEAAAGDGSRLSQSFRVEKRPQSE